jgi:5-methylcytosine-specific restriction enzyme subunit McrC
MHGSVNLWCEFDEHTDDLKDNRILMWTLHRLRDLSFKNPTVGEKIETAYRGLLGAIALEPIDAADCVDRIYNRLNEDYRSIHMLCKFFLDSIGPAYKKGDIGFVPFTLLYMPTLFQKFVAKWLDEHAPYIAIAQVPLDLDSSVFPPPQYFVDVVLYDRESRDVVGLLDTKYKLPTKKTAAEPTNQELNRYVEFADLNQVVAYAAELGTTKALLVYPSHKERKIWVKVKDICVKTIVFDIAASDLGETQFLSDLQAALS